MGQHLQSIGAEAGLHRCRACLDQLLWREPCQYKGLQGRQRAV